METQNLILQTINGNKVIKVPTGFQYDKTAIVAWNKLLNVTEQLIHAQQSKRSLLRDQAAMAAQRRALANVLADSLGMADFFWEQASLELAKTM